ncbi:DUF2805 domain-containing protein [Flavobacterium sp.]
MKKSRQVALDYNQLQRAFSMANEERKPYEALKAEFSLSENDVNEMMKKRLPKEKYDIWKKKAQATKPKPKPLSNDLDDDLDSKYYIKNKFD